MKFINEDGNVVEGIALSDAEAVLREQLSRELHKRICGTYTNHSLYDRKHSGAPVCEKVANYFLETFHLTVNEGKSIETSYGLPESVKDIA